MTHSGLLVFDVYFFSAHPDLLTCTDIATSHFVQSIAQAVRLLEKMPDGSIRPLGWECLITASCRLIVEQLFAGMMSSEDAQVRALQADWVN